MAYKNRGGSIKEGLKSSRSSGYTRIGFHRPVFINYGEYFVWEMITLIIIVGIAIFTIALKSESPYIYDPISNIKENFIDLQMTGLILGGVILGISITKRKSSKNAYKFFVATLISLLTIIIITVFGYTDFAKNYNEEAFEKMYTETAMKINITGDPKNLFIDECKKLNQTFNIKVVSICVVEYILIIFDLFFLISEIKMREKYEKIEKENDVLFDEKINIK